MLLSLVAIYVLIVLVVTAWRIAWGYTASPSALTFGKPTGALAQNVFALSLLLELAFLAVMAIPNVLDGLRNPSQHRSPAGFIVFGVVSIGAFLLLASLAWFLCTHKMGP